jgi:hypothetical protein
MSNPAAMNSDTAYPDFEFDFESGGEIYAEPVLFSNPSQRSCSYSLHAAIMSLQPTTKL